ncbi:MAG: alpha-glucuronidase [Anaerolineae bacterium]|nr:alpha-glucuronidase [Anaerolineae bacterium]
MNKLPKISEDGYELWLRYRPIEDEDVLTAYRSVLTQVVTAGASPTLKVAEQELLLGLEGLLGGIPQGSQLDQPGTLVIGTSQNSPITEMPFEQMLAQINDEGFLILSTVYRELPCTVITAKTDSGVLYGVFHFLRQMQNYHSLHHLQIISAPKIRLRLLNHWDNLDGTIERGYAGFSLWDWHKLPGHRSPRYTDYARANASIGINGTVLNNVNANPLILTEQYLHKAAALAETFRPYGIRVYLAPRFSSPIELGRLKTADPLDAVVIQWWRSKVREIYEIIPDFGGFLVKANSEGQPGPQDYERTHAEGANLLADALAPYGGVVIWRAFVYKSENPEDRAKQAYHDLVPQDGTFAPNVLLQVKNGPIDFQPREPYHPIFGAMPQTPLMLEFQITQEYLGLATNLVYLAPLFKETLEADTGCAGTGSLVAHVVDGSLDNHKLSGLAGVANTGSDRNWCGHPFAAANWYAFGRLAWDHRLSADSIAEEWLRMTFSSVPHFVEAAKNMMIESREAVVNYMTPLGLHHIMARDHHYGPGPWVTGGRADWTSPYYHQADQWGIGFDRTASGSSAISQYCSPYRDQIANPDTCPENLLLWFHHVSWKQVMKSGRTLWQELCFKYNEGVDQVRQFQKTWASLAEFVDPARFEHVTSYLEIQEQEARWWRDACLLYFQTFSNQAIPPEYEQPARSLDYYMNLEHYFVPGIPERRF